MPLTSKIQYNNFEPGEFIEEKERTYEETIALIEQFPWETERTNHPLGPTNSSVTIQGDKNNYLKLTFYYNNKFALYYLDAEDHLYTQPLERYEDAYPYIQSLFSSPDFFDTADFKLEHLWMHGKSIHFKNKDFHYAFNKSGWWLQMGLTWAYLGSILALVVLLIIFRPSWQILFLTPAIALIAYLVPTFFFVAIKNYRVSRDKILVLSKGNDIFYFGPADKPARFDKKDIGEITVYGGQGRRNSLTGFSKIQFKQNPVGCIYISDMILSDTNLQAKLPGIPYSYKINFPRASIPSSF